MDGNKKETIVAKEETDGKLKIDTELESGYYFI
jgi:hypothetical protein